MAKDLSLMTEPFQLQYYQTEKARIWEKRNADEYLKKFGGSLDDFPEN